MPLGPATAALGIGNAPIWPRSMMGFRVRASAFASPQPRTDHSRVTIISLSHRPSSQDGSNTSRRQSALICHSTRDRDRSATFSRRPTTPPIRMTRTTCPPTRSMPAISGSRRLGRRRCGAAPWPRNPGTGRQQTRPSPVRRVRICCCTWQHRPHRPTRPGAGWTPLPRHHLGQSWRCPRP